MGGANVDRLFNDRFRQFREALGYSHRFTFDHYIRAFGIDFTNWRLTGVAWDSYFTTLTISAIAAPLTAIVGLSTTYLLVRQKFVGEDAFEFSTKLSFAIPGTVIGVSYIMVTGSIVGRVENGEFGLAIAYSAVLIVTMLAAILLMQLLVGTRRLRRTERVQQAAKPA